MKNIRVLSALKELGPAFGLALSFFVSINYVHAEAPPMSSDILEHLDKDKFEQVLSVKKLPEPVQKYYSRNSGIDISKEFADPGKPWTSGCVRSTDGPPSKSLILAAKSGKICLVYYESGGFALVDKIDMFSLHEKAADLVWSNSMIGEHPKNLEQLLKSARTRAHDKAKP